MGETARENTEFRILSAIGMILVVAGHLDYDVFTVGGLFPYYSFHVFIFLFVSGYFYRKEAQEHIFRYLLKKCTALLLPYYLWNLFYGFLTFLFHKAGFTIGQDLSLYTLLIAPFDGGHQFMYQFPAWFVPALFLTEAVNVCIRKMLMWIRVDNEWVLLAGYLLAGMLTVHLAAGGHVWGYYKIPGRILFMLPGFQFGRIYRDKLEKRDILPNGMYFLLVMSVQLVIHMVTGGRLAFSTVWVSGFVNGPIVPYLTVIIGIAFWLRVAKVIQEIPHLVSGFVLIGRNTYSIMMHHIVSFFLVNVFFYVIHQITPLCEEFDSVAFGSDINYLYLPGSIAAFKWVYLAVGLGLPVLLSEVLKRKLDRTN